MNSNLVLKYKMNDQIWQQKRLKIFHDIIILDQMGYAKNIRIIFVVPKTKSILIQFSIKFLKTDVEIYLFR